MLFYRPVKGLNHFNLIYNYGTAQFAYAEYIVTRKGNSYSVSIKPRDEESDEHTEFEISADAAGRFVELLNKYRVGMWQAFNFVNKRVLDGHAFNFKVIDADGHEINAHGYAVFPPGYKEFREEADELFENWYRGIGR